MGAVRAPHAGAYGPGDLASLPTLPPFRETLDDTKYDRKATDDARQDDGYLSRLCHMALLSGGSAK